VHAVRRRWRPVREPARLTAGVPFEPQLRDQRAGHERALHLLLDVDAEATEGPAHVVRNALAHQPGHILDEQLLVEVQLHRELQEIAAVGEVVKEGRTTLLHAVDRSEPGEQIRTGGHGGLSSVGRRG
jgi:hypothetical protein